VRQMNFRPRNGRIPEAAGKEQQPQPAKNCESLCPAYE